MPGQPWILRILTGELRLLKAALWDWRAQPVTGGGSAFSCHRHGANYLLLWVLVPLVLLETIVLHLLLRRLAGKWIWVLTDVGLIGALYLVGLAKSLRLYPTIVTETCVVLRLGLFRERRIAKESILEVFPVSGPGNPARLPAGMRLVKLTFFDPPCLAIRARGHGGMEQIEFNIDEPARFQTAVTPS